MSIANFSGSAISSTYQRLVQTDGTFFADGTGSLLSIIAASSSVAISASYAGYAVTASYLDTYLPPFPYTGSAEITGSLNVIGPFTASSSLITGNVVVLGTASINTLVVNQTQLSTGSNQLGDAADDTQTLYGTVRIPTGSFTVTGSTMLKGVGTSSATTTLRVQNANTSASLVILDNGSVWSSGPGFRTTNTSFGSGSLLNPTGEANVALGVSVLTGNVAGDGNVAIGWKSLRLNTEGYDNIAIGRGALEYNLTGDDNIALGPDALLNLQDGISNIALGWLSLSNANNSEYNTAIGIQSAQNIRKGNANVALGDAALFNLKQGTGNTSLGAYSSTVGASTTSSFNTAVGYIAGNIEDGNYNTHVGANASGFYTGSFNTVIGANLPQTAITSSGRLNNSVILADGSGSIRLFSPSSSNILVGTLQDSGHKFQVSGSARITDGLTLTGSLIISGSFTSSQDIQVNGVNIGRGPGALPLQNHNISLGVNNFSSSLNSSYSQIAIGYNAFRNLENGYYSIALGGYAMEKTTVVDESIAIGLSALRNAISPGYSVAVGNGSLVSETGGYGNTSVGSYAGGNLNSALGGYGNNAFFGAYAAAQLRNAQESVAIGNGSLFSSTANTNLSAGNIAVGYYAGYSWFSGSQNIWLGYNTAGFSTGSNNVIIGGNLPNSIINGNSTLNNSVILADGSGSIRLFSPSSSNVIIGGTTDLGYKLQVSGSGNFTGNLLVTGSGIFSGSVGIGTSSPSYKLDVVGTTRTTATVFNPNTTNWVNGALRVDGAFGGGISIVDNVAGFGMWAQDGGATFILGQGSTGGGLSSHFTLKSTGNVGIGTTSPGYQLTLAGRGAASVFGVDNGNSFVAKNTSGNYETYLWPRWTDNYMYLNYANNGFFIRNNNSVTTMFMTGDNKVGIGTTTPSEKLHVDGNIRASYAAGIYNFVNTVNSGSTTQEIFSIDIFPGGVAFKLTCTNNTSAFYSGAKIFEVVRTRNQNPVVFKVADTGANGADDFDISISTPLGSKLTISVTNKSPDKVLVLATSMWLGANTSNPTITTP
jgi:hypothetical protein